MPSIRRSLTLYLVLLVGGGLAVVAAVTDGLVGRTLEARRAAEADRIRAKFDVQGRVDRDRLDDELRADVRTVLAQLVGRFGAQNNLFFRVELPLAEILATPFPLAHAAWVAGPDRGPTRGGPAVGKAVQAHFDQIRLGDGVLPPADPAHPDPHPPLCLVTVTGRYEPLLRTTSLGAADFPPVPPNPDRAFEFDFTYDTISVGGADVRRVTLKAPWLGGGFAPRRPPGRNPTPGDRPDRGGLLPPRLTIHYARPLATLDDELAKHQQEMADQLATLDDDLRHDRAALRLSLAGVAGGTFLGILVGGPLLVRRGLRPVDRLSDAVGRVSERDFNLPVEARDVGRELLPIHDRLTHTLSALRRAFDREKQAVADISHELRTPVAGLQATLDVALRKPRTAEQYKTTIEESRAIVRQLGRLVERVLTLARLDADTVDEDGADRSGRPDRRVRGGGPAAGRGPRADRHRRPAPGADRRHRPGPGAGGGDEPALERRRVQRRPAAPSG